CSTISKGTRRSSRCSPISLPRIQRSSRASERTSRPDVEGAAAAVAAVAAGGGGGAGGGGARAGGGAPLRVVGGGGGRAAWPRRRRGEGVGHHVSEGPALFQRHVSRDGAVESAVVSGGDGPDLDALG